MTNTSIALQDLAESKLKFVENQFTSEYDDAEHSAKDHSAKDLTEIFTKNFTENLSKNLERDHLDDDNVSFEE